MSNLLEVRGLDKRYPGVWALRDLNFAVSAGEVHCLVGQNGAGKSTLIKCVSGLIAPSAGRIHFCSAPLPVGNPAASLARGIATIYQELDFVEDLSVAENILLGHEPHWGPFVDRKTMRERARTLLAQLGHEHLDPDARAGSLRPAAHQMISIARALSHNLRLLIMDEPTAVLDPPEVSALLAVVRRLTANGVGVIYISHRLYEVARIGDRITVLKDGQITASDLPPDTPPSELVAFMVGHARPAPTARPEASVATALPAEQTPPAAEQPNGPTTQLANGPTTQLAVGQSAASAAESGPPTDHRQQPNQAENRALLTVRGLTRYPYADGIDLAVHAGEIVGIAGLVGSGRTELLRCIYGLDVPTAGEVLVDGVALAPGRPDRAVRAGIGFAPEERKSAGIWPFWSLTRNASIADLARLCTAGLIQGRRERDETRRHLRALATEPDDPDRRIDQLSGGNQQKVVLARWLLRSGRVLLLDEPTRGVDVGAKAEIFTVIRTLAGRGLAVLLVSSELAELIGLCDRILVLRDGRIRAQLPGHDCSEADILHHAVPATEATNAGHDDAALL